jgi:hypothetical protein
MLELDLIGHKITLTEGDARLLLGAAEAASGSSIGSRDLATRLKARVYPSSRRLVFSRPEARALQRMIQAQPVPSDRLRELGLTLTELLAQSPAAGTTRC